MADKKQLHEFALKWSEKFKDSNIRYEELVGHWFADDCARLGFEMDSGKTFSEVYGEAFTNYEALQKVIDDITDIYLLGSAIYSRWRYFNHWEYDPSDILKTENRQWFLMVLHSIAQLYEENPFGFQGTLKKLYLISNNMCYGPMPDSNDEIEQHLTVLSDGHICLEYYQYVQDSFLKRINVKQNVKERKKIEQLFVVIASCFEYGYDEPLVKDVGSWSLELTNTEGKVYTYEGPMCEKLMYAELDLSNLIRNTIGIADAFAFDGNEKDVINKITIDYCRLTNRITEQLVIDRETGSLEHRKHIGTNGTITHTYEIERNRRFT